MLTNGGGKGAVELGERAHQSMDASRRTHSDGVRTLMSAPLASMEMKSTF